MPAKMLGDTRCSPPSLSHIWPRSHKFPIPTLVCSSELPASDILGSPSTEMPRIWPSYFWDQGTGSPCLGLHTLLFLAKQLAEKALQQWAPSIGDEHCWLLFAISLGLQEKQRETVVKALLTTAKHLLMFFLCRTERGTGDHGMRKNSSQISLPSCRKGPKNPYLLSFTPFPLELL